MRLKAFLTKAIATSGIKAFGYYYPYLMGCRDSCGQPMTNTIHPFEYPLPKKVYQDGVVDFAWTCGESQRDSQVAEL